MNYNLIIEPINIEDVFNNPNKFNTSNHWVNNVKPDDYDEISKMNWTKNWISKFKDEYIRFSINDPYTINWMKQAHQISRQTKKFSKLFQDELDEFVKNNSQLITTKDTPYFVRCENVSLKYGEHGPGPYYSLKQIIESTVSSSDGHSPIDNTTTELTFYLIPFCYKISNSNEFRVFVNNNKITAISQQALYNTWVPEIAGNTNDILKQYVQIIVENFNLNVNNKITWYSSYSYDIAIIKSGNSDEILEPYFIEPNPFGKEYSSGSSLFHWINDYEKLYGNDVNNNIYLRYTYKNT